MVNGPYGVCIQKNTRRGFDKISCFISFEVDVGSNKKFWHDSWCGDQSLKEAFPKLFRNACNKEDSMVDYLRYSECFAMGH